MRGCCRSAMRSMQVLRALDSAARRRTTCACRSRIVHLPLSWDDPATRLAIEKYMQSVRKDAPWCPTTSSSSAASTDSHSVDEVQRIVFDASYLVMGLGDVYLGAPVATPLDPRHRLVTTKYNPARTWTPENAVGIGGAYLCVYGMEGPGGYQFVGRTVQMWNRFRQTPDFHRRQALAAALLRPDPLLSGLGRRTAAAAGRISPMAASVCASRRPRCACADYRRFLQDNAASIEAFRASQRAAFDAERQRWRDAGLTESTCGG